MFLVLNGVYIFVLKQPYFECHKVVLDILSRFALWGHIAMMGYSSAKYNVLDWLNQYTNKLKPWFLFAVAIFVTGILIVLRYRSGATYKYSISYDVLYSPILIYCLLIIVNFIKLKPICLTLTELSKQSTYMWFLHALYFTPLSSFQWIAYKFESPFLILVTTLLTMYLLSTIIDMVVMIITKIMVK